MKVGISGECTLQRIDRGLRLAAVGQHEAEIGEDDRVTRFDALGGVKCFGGIIELPLSGLTRGETQMCVGRGQLRVDRRAKSGGSVAATIRFEQHVTEPEVRLRVLWILGEDATQRSFQLRTTQLSRRYLRNTRRECALVFRIRPRRTACCAATNVAERLQAGRRFRILSLCERGLGTGIPACLLCQSRSRARVRPDNDSYSRLRPTRDETARASARRCTSSHPPALTSADSIQSRTEVRTTRRKASGNVALCRRGRPIDPVHRN